MCRDDSLQHIRRLKIVQKTSFQFSRSEEGEVRATVPIARESVGGVRRCEVHENRFKLKIYLRNDGSAFPFVSLAVAIVDDVLRSVWKRGCFFLNRMMELLMNSRVSR